MLLGIQSSTGAQSGKDTVAAMMQKIDPLIDLYALASPIKDSINKLFHWDERHANGVLKEIPVLVLSPSREEWIEVVGDYFRHHDKLMTIAQVIDAGNRIDKVYREWAFSGHRMMKEITPFGRRGDVEFVNVSPREMYQLFGTDMMRDCISDSFWTDIAPTENTIITDIRFDNEVRWLYDNQGFLLDVQRPNNKAVIAEHSSEAGTGHDGQEIIINDGDLSQLKYRTETAFSSLQRQDKEGA